jgi:multiple sugar transport system ATP-binding protein
MNMLEATLAKANGGLSVDVGGQRLALDQELLSTHSALHAFEGKQVVLGIRPEDLEDASLAKDVPADRRLSGKVELTEALGSEIMAHFTVDAPPALTEDVKELAQDVGDERAVREAAEGSKQHTTMVGRFDPRSKVKEGDTAEVAVDTRGLHFFDPETGLGIYGDKRQGEETR